MSNDFEVEPPTTGKVLFYTSYGPLEFELWCKECPKWCRNFIQLCLEGYYDQTTFHRLVRNFVIQGGDPTGTGKGGESTITPNYIPAEYHTKLKWSRRGLLGVAAMNDSNEGGSQFFITLDTTPELYKKATLFGKVVGDTIYNAVRMSELETENRTSDRLVNPPIILRTEVILNPFDDIIPRELEEVQIRRSKSNETKNRQNNLQPSKPSITAIKNKKVLSFDNEDEDDERERGGGTFTSGKIKSSHEVLKGDKSLSKDSIVIDLNMKNKSVSDNPNIVIGDPNLAEASNLHNKPNVKDQIAEIQKELRMMNQSVTDPIGTVESSESIKKSDSLSKLLGVKKHSINEPSLLGDQRNAYKERKNIIMGKRGRSAMEEMDTLLALNNFRDKLKTADTNDPVELSKRKIIVDPAKKLDICKLHGLVNCESCKDTFGIRDDGVTEEGWLMHRLVFDKEAGYREMRADLNQLKVIDPRQREEQFKK